ncbi:MAG TPA: hypothetical protein VL576_01260 [Candidatus Paceibacterota bacterium]|jgi:hypothetical protein|nr:hypothetical protein [Candidatus Paceibacterota bacterium]
MNDINKAKEAIMDELAKRSYKYLVSGTMAQQNDFNIRASDQRKTILIFLISESLKEKSIDFFKEIVVSAKLRCTVSFQKANVLFTDFIFDDEQTEPIELPTAPILVDEIVKMQALTSQLEDMIGSLTLVKLSIKEVLGQMYDGLEKEGIRCYSDNATFKIGSAGMHIPTISREVFIAVGMRVLMPMMHQKSHLNGSLNGSQKNGSAKK